MFDIDDIDDIDVGGGPLRPPPAARAEDDSTDPEVGEPGPRTGPQCDVE